MLVIGNKFGQLANRLFAFSHFIANAIEYQYELVNFNFDEYSPYFTSTAKNDFNPYQISVVANPIQKKIYQALSLASKAKLTRSPWHEVVLAKQAFDLKEPDFQSLLKTDKKVITRGWLFRDYENFEKHSETLRNLFQPIPIHQERVANLMNTCKNSCDILVGVHIRKGDYKTWQGGAYFYEDHVYADKMAQLESTFKQSGQTVAFLVCSNESINTDNFKPLNVHLSTNHLVEDLYTLAQCNYLIGPPSTYSSWASFYGKVPLIHLQNAQQKIDLSEFAIAKG